MHFSNDNNLEQMSIAASRALVRLARLSSPDASPWARTLRPGKPPQRQPGGASARTLQRARSHRDGLWPRRLKP